MYLNLRKSEAHEIKKKKKKTVTVRSDLRNYMLLAYVSLNVVLQAS